MTIGHTPNVGMTVTPLQLTPYNGVMFTLDRSLRDRDIIDLSIKDNIQGVPNN